MIFGVRKRLYKLLQIAMGIYKECSKHSNTKPTMGFPMMHRECFRYGSRLKFR
jgi:hypothetical protein